MVMSCALCRNLLWASFLGAINNQVESYVYYAEPPKSREDPDSLEGLGVGGLLCTRMRAKGALWPSR